MQNGSYFCYDPLFCSRCHKVIRDINEIHFNNQMKPCKASKPAKGAFVYLIHDEDKNLLKIGFTENPTRRFKEIKNANNNKTKIIGYIIGTKTNEANLHRKWKRLHAKLEWFNYDEEIIDYFLNHPSFKNLN